ncbi:unnamed protein product (macronuclear) [Paramecium tetraurelia]|uniref:Uncharacterized protein n=1 Tax=Paramecium tetraurelia TaxID=5888 RepID=A0DU74_PARTE|nr:uncharacterized protein GSPATT00020263001 [Paramecium tetraurelia]CAK86591.1 unnamed protein product [Paramecium tetraurelia]|eukprot:XP_001453988.1 hypothetical protein (macronuclear) [Paramecium tetraurelia strain d4-2]
MYQYYSSRSSNQENDRNRSFGNMLNSTKSDTLQTDQKHSGCLQRLQLLVQELDRMAEAQQRANQEIASLRQELEQAKQNNQTLVLNNGFDSEILEELKLQQQKFNQYKQVKEQQVEQLENELLQIHKQFKEEKLIRMDLNQKFEQKQIEVDFLQKELQRNAEQHQDQNDSGILNQLHEDVIELQCQNKELKNINLGYQKQIEQLLENQQIMEQKLKQYQAEISFQPSPNKSQYEFSPQYKTESIKKYNRTKTMQPMDFVDHQSLNQQPASRPSLNVFQQRLSMVQIGQTNDLDTLQNQQDTIKKDTLRSKPKPVENIKYSKSKFAQQF